MGINRRLIGLQAWSCPGFRNWVPKISDCKILGHPYFSREITIYDLLLEKYLLKNHSQKIWMSWGGEIFEVLGVQYDTHTPCWLIPDTRNPDTAPAKNLPRIIITLPKDERTDNIDPTPFYSDQSIESISMHVVKDIGNGRK